MAVRGGFRASFLCAIRHRFGQLRRRERLSLGPIVLAYHGVVEKLSPGSLDRYSIDRTTLKNHLRFFQRTRKVVSVIEMLDCLTDGKPLDPRWVVLTFDDGLKSQATLGAEILESEKVPWALSVPAGLIGTEQTVWTYEVRFLVTRLWNRDCLPIPGIRSRLLKTQSMHQKEAAADELLFVLTHQTAEECRDAHIEELRSVVGTDRLKESMCIDGRFVMATWGDMRRLASNGVTLMSHGWLHRPQNATIGDASSEEELLISRQFIASQTGVTPDVFVLPNGIVDSVRRSMISNAGYKYCFSSHADRVRRDVDLLNLPRIDAEYSLPVLRHHVQNSIQ